MYSFIPPLIVLVRSDSEKEVLRVVYAIVRLSSGKTMASIPHVDLISCQYFLNTIYV